MCRLLHAAASVPTFVSGPVAIIVIAFKFYDPCIFRSESIVILFEI